MGLELLLSGLFWECADLQKTEDKRFLSRVTETTPADEQYLLQQTFVAAGLICCKH
jgi:hypothetical protein